MEALAVTKNESIEIREYLDEHHLLDRAYCELTSGDFLGVLKRACCKVADTGYRVGYHAGYDGDGDGENLYYGDSYQ